MFNVGIDKITTDQFIVIDRDVSIAKITTDLFMLTWM